MSKHSGLEPSYTSRLPARKSNSYKQKLWGSFFALVFLLAILYGRSEHYTPSSKRPPGGKVDYSGSDWMKKLSKIQAPTLADAPPKDNKSIKALVLILKEYRYWENKVNLARKANDKDSETYALSNYRQAMEKVSRYSDKAIKKAEEELKKSGWDPTMPITTDNSNRR